MIPPPVPHNEAARLAALRAQGLLDTPAEERFDRITRLASRLFDVPIALFSLVDEGRQWFKSAVGVDIPETPRGIAFCAHAIPWPETLEVKDAQSDPRFSENPLVTGDMGLRFYAGHPISTHDNFRIGTLCILDRKPRSMSEADHQAFDDLAAMVEAEVNRDVPALTHGIHGPASFQLLSEHLLKLCRRMSLNALLARVSVTGLTALAERLGPGGAEDALVEMGQLLRRNFREADVIAQVGPETFAMLMAGGETSQIAGINLRLSDAVERANTYQGRSFDLTYSVGVTHVAANDAHIIEAELQADPMDLDAKH